MRQPLWRTSYDCEPEYHRIAKTNKMQTNSVIDLSHHNAPVDLARARGDGIQAVIHKASQGVVYTDPQYVYRKHAAQQLGLLWGAYHFGDGTDGRTQAEHFLTASRADDNVLCVLDLEENTEGGDTISLVQAYDFLNCVKNRTGRWPVLYGGWYLRTLVQGKPDAILNNCPLWVSDYRGTNEPVIPTGWSTWNLWQYTDGTNGSAPFTVAGIGKCDRDLFNGTPDELATFWHGVKAQAL